MRMTTGRSPLGLRSPPIFPHRPGMPCPKHSPYEYRHAVYDEAREAIESRNFYETRSSPVRETTLISSSSSTSSRVNLALSTPSPSASANGERVDSEIEKLRRLSEEWVRNREIEESENTVDILRSRSPSPQRHFKGTPSPNQYVRSNSAESENSLRNQRSYRSPSPQKSTPTSPLRSSPQRTSTPSSPVRNPFFRKPYTPETVEKLRKSRSPSPKRPTFTRSNSYDQDDSYNNSPNQSGSASQKEASPRPFFRRSSSFDGSDSNYTNKYYSLRSRSPSPKTDIIYRRSNSYESEERLQNFRSRSKSPQGLTPASRYYRRSSSYEESDNYTVPRLRSRSPSPQSLSLWKNIFKRSKSYEGSHSGKDYNPNFYRNFSGDSHSAKFNTLPRRRSPAKSRSPVRDDLHIEDFLNDPVNFPTLNRVVNQSTALRNLFKSPPRSLPGIKTAPVQTRSSSPDKNHFLPYTIPELPSFTMTSTQRRYSEEATPPFRKPLATLHEDEFSSRRRFSDDLRKRSNDSTDSSDEYYRRLSEAGVRKLSDAHVVLSEDTDSFIIGDRVWVGGTKPGAISYIGETQFAPGDWAGVTLDDTSGKNDGSVGGIRYFQCEPRKGVFSRLTRLARYPITDYDREFLVAKTSTVGSDSPRNYSTPTPSTASGPTSSRRLTPTSSSYPSGEAARKVSLTNSYSKVGSPSLSNSVRKSSSPSPVTYTSDAKIGDRVIIHGNTGIKHGVLRYIGKTEFADGTWGGVELDEPIGKNDGSVAGKKYFSCRAKHGLFALIGRISRSNGSQIRRISATSNSSTSRSIPTVRRAGSRESLGTSSVTSSTMSSSLKGTRRPSRPSTGSVPSTKALQETLAEKTQHVEQLLHERDLERTEVVRMASQADEAVRVAQDLKTQLDQLQIESEERLHDLGEKVQMMEQENKDLWAKIDDKQKEMDDLTFQLEEESIAKSDLETQSITNQEQIKEIQNKLVSEQKKSQLMGTDGANKVYEMEEIEISLRASVEELQAKVMDLEQGKEDLETKIEKQTDVLVNKEAEMASFSNTMIEKDQKIHLLESTKQKEEVRCREKSAEMHHLEQKIRKIQLEVEKRTKDYHDVSQQAEEFLEELECEKQAKEVIIKELRGLKDNEAEIKSEMEKAKNLTESLQNKLKMNDSKINTLEAEEQTLRSQLNSAADTTKSSSDELLNLNLRIKEKDEEITQLQDEAKKQAEGLESITARLQIEHEKSENSKNDLQHSKESISLLENSLQQKEAEAITKRENLNEITRQLTNSQKHISELEDLRKRLETQLETAMSSSTTSSDQLRNLNQQLRDMESKLSTTSEKERTTSSELAKTKEDLSNYIQKNELVSSELAKAKEDMSGHLQKNEEELINLRSKNEKEFITLSEDFEQFKKKSFSEMTDKEIVVQNLISEKEQLNLKNLEESQQSVDQLKELEVSKSKLEVEMENMRASHKIEKDQFELNMKEILSKIDTFAKEKEEINSEYEATLKLLRDDTTLLKKNLDTKTALLSQTEQKFANVTGEVEILQTQLSSYREELETLTTSGQSDRKEMEDLRKSLDDESERLVQLGASLEINKAEKCKLVDEKAKLSELLNNMKNIEDEKNNLCGVKNKLDETLKKLSEETSKSTSIQDENKELVNKLKLLSKITEERDNTIKDNDKLKHELEKLNNLENELQNMKIEKILLETDVEEGSMVKKAFNELTTTYELSKTENAALIDSESLLKENFEKLELKCMEEKKSLLDQFKNKEEEDVNSFKKLENNYSDSLGTINDLQKVINDLETKNKSLEGKLLEQVTIDQGKQETFKTKIMEIEKSVQEHKESLKEKIENLEIEKHNLIEEVVTFQNEASRLKDELQTASENLNKTRSEDSETAELRLRLITVEAEKRKIEMELKESKDKLCLYQESSSGSHESEFVFTLKNEKEQLEGQVNFLNSVIVDMQRNKEEMLVKLDAFKSGNLPDDEKTNINGLREKRVAPRLFCDICDCFDLHDTEDCPKQATSDSPPPSRHYGDRKATRSYCDTCEVFGHTKEECPEEETF